MEKSKNYSNLIVWQKVHNLVLDIYRMMKEFPNEEMYGLTSQLKRAAISIPANIAEGFGREGKKDKLRFYNIATGSLNEGDYYLLFSNDLGYMKTIEIKDKIEEIGGMMKSYIKTIRANINY